MCRSIDRVQFTDHWSPITVLIPQVTNPSCLIMKYRKNMTNYGTIYHVRQSPKILDRSRFTSRRDWRCLGFLTSTPLVEYQSEYYVTRVARVNRAEQVVDRLFLFLFKPSEYTTVWTLEICSIEFFTHLRRRDSGLRKYLWSLRGTCQHADRQIRSLELQDAYK